MAAETLSDLFDAACVKYADRVALMTPDGQPVTFARSLEIVKSFSARLRDEGIVAGHTIAVSPENSAVYYLMAMAVQRIGATFAVTHSADGAIRHGLNIDAAITQPDAPTVLTRNIPFDQNWFSHQGDSRIVSGGHFVFNSSGTTGVPKYYVVDQSLPVNWLHAWEQADSFQDMDVLSTLPIFSLFGIIIAITGNLSGGAFYQSSASPEETLRNLSPQQDICIKSVPSMIKDILDAVENGAPVPKNLKQVMMSGSAISKNFAQKIEDVLGCPALNGYGATETGPTATPRPAKGPVDDGYIGHALPGVEIRLEDENGNEPALGDEGEIAILVPEHSRVKETVIGTPAYDPKGWFRPGDVGYRLPDGDLVLTGRVSELINNHGVKVAPSLYEKLARRVLGVADVAAFGVPNNEGSENVALAIVDKMTISDEDAVKLLRQGNTSAVDFQIFHVQDIPKNLMGKTDRIKLRELFISQSA